MRICTPDVKFVSSVVGALCQGQHAAFATALLFAQDYGILVASLQDRPFVPKTTVVLEGVPRDMKAAFRRWDDNVVATAALISGRRQRGSGSVKVMDLAAAIAATRGQV